MQQAATVVESNKVIDGRRDGRSTPYHNTADFCWAYKATISTLPGVSALVLILQHTQGSICVCAEPMGDDFTM